jgi:hypothetical protein
MMGVTAAAQLQAGLGNTTHVWRPRPIGGRASSCRKHLEAVLASLLPTGHASPPRNWLPPLPLLPHGVVSKQWLAAVTILSSFQVPRPPRASTPE